eukprot:11598007-Alexandrium_andersonii.AAC.1
MDVAGSRFMPPPFCVAPSRGATIGKADDETIKSPPPSPPGGISGGGREDVRGQALGATCWARW